ncbi:CPBP family intramembrane glutamic endopeptidase [Nonomuraea sp. NPDC000554]|uniref:CPBP family intramembrane glutamic endopeptidase n=1 Tax=Nonomuraea sp. NPDC000554 TaxID=3154259 RepID=UPI00332F48C8
MRSKTTLFLGVALVGAWLVVLPAWLSGKGLEFPLLPVLAGAMMFTPAIAVLVVWLRSRREGLTFRLLARETGLTLGPRKGRTLAVLGAMWLGVPLLVALTLAVSALVGAAELDVDGLSGLRRALESAGVDSSKTSIVAIGMLVGMFVTSLITAVLAFGEEWGWRGWLLPRLLRHGTLPAVLVSGVIWAAWHAPLTLLGYNYPDLGPWAALMFVPFCTVFGAVLAWTRLVTGSVWPAVIGHAIFNESATTLIVLSSDASAPFNPVLAGPGGLVGGLIIAPLAVLLLLGAGRGGRALPLPGHRLPTVPEPR